MRLGELFSLSSAVIWAFAVILFTRIGRQLPPFELNLIKNLVGFGLLLLTALFIEGIKLPQIPARDWVLILISGIIGIAVADTLYMKALNTIGAGSTGVVAALYSPFVILLSMIYLNESLSFWQWLGLISVLAGVLVISFEAPIKTSAPLNQFRGIIYGVSSVFLTALGIVIMKPILEQQPFFWSSSLRFLAGIAGMLAYLRWFGDWQKSFSHIQAQQHWPRVLLASVLGGYLAMMLWLAGYKFTDASVAAILNETTSIFIVFLAWLLLKEALTLRKLIGSMFAFLGVYMVLMS